MKQTAIQKTAQIKTQNNPRPVAQNNDFDLEKTLEFLRLQLAVRRVQERLRLAEVLN